MKEKTGFFSLPIERKVFFSFPMFEFFAIQDKNLIIINSVDKVTEFFNPRNKLNFVKGGLIFFPVKSLGRCFISLFWVLIFILYNLMAKSRI